MHKHCLEGVYKHRIKNLFAIPLLQFLMSPSLNVTVVTSLCDTVQCEGQLLAHCALLTLSLTYGQFLNRLSSRTPGSPLFGFALI